MKLQDFIAAMDTFAPRELAFEGDNPGLLVGTDRQDIKRVLVALDCTIPVVNEAVGKGCDLVLTHHPLMYRPVRKILPDDPITSPVFYLIRNNIGLFAAHTNLDAAKGGVNAELCKLLGILDPIAVGEERIMRVGNLANPVKLYDFIRFAENVLATRFRFTGEDRIIRRIAVMGGAGGGDYPLAHAFGADLYITGECKHNQAIEAETLGLSIAVGGHFETENPVLIPLIEYLESHTEGIEYSIAETNVPVFKMT